MRGGLEETSASFEARSAPRSYPTRAPNWRPTDHSPDPEMVEGGCAGRGPLDRDNGGYPARIRGIAPACKRVPPLCLRSLGPAVAQAPRDGRYDRRALCRRYDRTPLANSPDWLKAAPMWENLLASWRQSGQKQDHCPSLLNHNAKYKRLLPPCCDFANGVRPFS